jgi:hypothetical protein
MTNFSPKLEDQSDIQLRNNINENHSPDFASLSSDELTRRSLAKLQESFVDFDKTTSKFSIVLGLFALVQIIIAGLQLVLDIKIYPDAIFSFFIAIVFIIAIVWFTKQVNKMTDGSNR